MFWFTSAAVNLHFRWHHNLIGQNSISLRGWDEHLYIVYSPVFVRVLPHSTQLGPCGCRRPCVCVCAPLLARHRSGSSAPYVNTKHCAAHSSIELQTKVCQDFTLVSRQEIGTLMQRSQRMGGLVRFPLVFYFTSIYYVQAPV